MPRQSAVAVVYFDLVEREIAAGPDMRELMVSITDDLAADMSAHAPRASGKGHAGGRHAADTLRGGARQAPDGWRGEVRWARPAYYLKFHDQGTVHMSARPFIQPAIDRYQNR